MQAYQCDRCSQMFPDKPSERYINLNLSATGWNRRRDLRGINVGIRIKARNANTSDPYEEVDICKSCVRETIRQVALHFGFELKEKDA